MKKILFVDDDVNMQKMVEIFLRGQGVHLEFASNGRSALHKLGKNEFDLVFSDVQMPEMDGIELLKSILISFPKMPVVLVSAYEKNQLNSKALEHGAKAVINKPFDSAQLIAIINGL